jgi:hypothetical protein
MVSSTVVLADGRWINWRSSITVIPRV